MLACQELKKSNDWTAKNAKKRYTMIQNPVWLLRVPLSFQWVHRSLSQKRFLPMAAMHWRPCLGPLMNQQLDAAWKMHRKPSRPACWWNWPTDFAGTAGWKFGSKLQMLHVKWWISTMSSREFWASSGNIRPRNMLSWLWRPRGKKMWKVLRLMRLPKHLALWAWNLWMTWQTCWRRQSFPSPCQRFSAAFVLFQQQYPKTGPVRGSVPKTDCFQDRTTWNWATIEGCRAVDFAVAMSLHLGIEQSKWRDGSGRGISVAVEPDSGARKLSWA